MGKLVPRLENKNTPIIEIDDKLYTEICEDCRKTKYSCLIEGCQKYRTPYRLLSNFHLIQDIRPVFRTNDRVYYFTDNNKEGTIISVNILTRMARVLWDNNDITEINYSRIRKID